jgi:hypothetical protein
MHHNKSIANPTAGMVRIVAAGCLLALLAVSGTLVQAYKDIDFFVTPTFDLFAKSYELDLVVSIQYTKDPALVFQIAEAHSSWQERSRLKFTVYGEAQTAASKQKDKLDRTNTIYSDGKQLLMIGWTRRACVSVSRDYVDELFVQRLLIGFESGHLIGAGRLLMFIEQNFSQFRSLATDETRATVQDQSRVKYEAKFRSKHNSKEFSIILVYDIQPNMNIGSRVPRMIIILVLSGPSITYEFTRFKPLPDGQLLADSSGQYMRVPNDLGDSLVFDMFALDRAAGCSRSMPEADTDSPKLASRDYRFSFNARPVTVRGMPQLDMAVVYEPSISVLSVDRVQASMAASTTIDFRQNRMYHALRRPSTTSHQSGGVLAPDVEQSCVVNRVKESARPAAGPKENPFTLGRMLLGTERYAFLGLARVRGIETRVYEAHHTDLPVWLQLPAVYEDREVIGPGQRTDSKTAEGLKMRDEANRLRLRRHSYTSVFYFANTGAERPDDSLPGKLVLIEVFTMHELTGRVIQTRMLPIYDFSWELPNTSPAGHRFEDSFSLLDNCLTETSEYAEQYASLELLIEASDLDERQLDWLRHRAQRNLALLNVAQLQLALASPMVFDVESRLTTVVDGVGERPSNKARTLLSVTMRAAERTKALAHLMFEGMAVLKRFDADEAYPASNFQVCHMLAAHKQRDTVFAYDMIEGLCLLLVPEPGVDIDQLMTETFQFRDKGNLEVYKISHHDDQVHVGGNENLNQLRLARSKMRRLRELQLFDPAAHTMSMPVDAQQMVPFKIRRFRIEPPSDNDDYYLDDIHVDDSNKFVGFGLVPDEPLNKLVEPKWSSGGANTHDYYQAEMTFESCRTACLVDFECRSFSVCIMHGKMQCVLTVVSFAEPTLVVQLMALMMNKGKSKLGEKFPLSLHEDNQNYIAHNDATNSAKSIQVVKYHGCELHIKLYSDLFKQRSSASSSYWRNFELVDHMEQCAEFCYRTTIEYMRSVAGKLKQDSPDGGEQPVASDPDAICSHFYYVDYETIQFETPEAARQIGELMDNMDKFSGGFCVLDAPKRRKTNELNLTTNVEFERHEFALLTLYTKQADVSLASLDMTLEEKMVAASMRPPQSFDSITNANYGSLVANTDLETCARLCFDQASRVAYPVCRSFDYLELTESNNPARKFCAFNSVSLKSSLAAQRFDLVKYGAERQTRVKASPGESVKVWHFDPRDGLVAKSLDEIYNIELDKLDAGSRGSRPISMPAFGLFCMTTLALGVGLIGGFVVGAKLMARLAAAGKDDVEALIGAELPPAEPVAARIQFSNMVDFEGQIRDNGNEGGGDMPVRNGGASESDDTPA